MSTRSLVSAVVLAQVLLVACNFGLVQGPDRPDPGDVQGPPPPADFHCERGARHVEDTDRDGHADRVVHVLGDGTVICQSEDRNHDGKIDSWALLQDGRVVEKAMDTNFDGTIDTLTPVSAAAGDAGTADAESGVAPKAP